MTKQIAIYGAGGFGREVETLVLELIQLGKQDWHFIGFFDDMDYSDRFGTLYLGNINNLNNWKGDLHVILAMGWSHIRRQAASKITNSKLTFPALISPKCIIGNLKKVHIGQGSILMAGANLTTDIELGEFVVININATIGHDSKLGNFTSIMPSVNISGGVVIEEEVFIGSGTTVLQSISIGSKSIIGAGAVVTKNIASGVTAAGVPARIIKSGNE